jgi:hypothetical protein
LALPIDPGKLRVEARSPGKRPWRRDLVVAEGERVEIEVGPLDDDLPEPAPHVEATEDHPWGGSRSRTQRYAALGVLGVGALGIGIASGFGVSALVKRDEASSLCPAKRNCPDGTAAREADDARRASTVSTVAFVAGGVLLATGAALYFTAPVGESPRARSGISALRVAVHPWGLACEGAF